MNTGSHETSSPDYELIPLLVFEDDSCPLSTVVLLSELMSEKAVRVYFDPDEIPRNPDFPYSERLLIVRSSIFAQIPIGFLSSRISNLYYSSEYGDIDRLIKRLAWRTL